MVILETASYSVGNVTNYGLDAVSLTGGKVTKLATKEPAKEVDVVKFSRIS